MRSNSKITRAIFQRVRGGNSRSGQAIVFMAMVLVFLAFVVLWAFDVNKTLFVKAKARNAGDSAALAAARWQGTTLNLIGELNVAQALAITEGLRRGETTFPEAEAISDLQTRLSFTGPLVGMMAAQQVAKNNGLFNNRSFQSELLSHVDVVRNDYAVFYPSAYAPLPPATTSWDEYADMIETIALEGVAVQAENAQYYAGYANMNHMLLNPSFYEAISSRHWCWFFHNAYSLLKSYHNWRDWSPLPPIEPQEPINSELFSLQLTRVSILDNVPLPSEPGWPDDYPHLFEEFTEEVISQEVAQVASEWFFFNPRDWASWDQRIIEDFPWDGEIRPEYNYGGADASIRVSTETERRGDSSGGDRISWTAAAKPFGTLEENVRPDRFGVVLPAAFKEVRLIPVDTSTAPQGAMQPGWLSFIYEILPLYMEHGVSALPSSNWYARQLITWESHDFRESGENWLELNSADCFHHGGGGGGGGGSGGTRRGH